MACGVNASMEPDRKKIKYSACASRKRSEKKSSQTYGISNHGALKNKVQGALQKTCEIRNEVMQIDAVKKRAFLRTLGLHVWSSSGSEPDNSSTSCEWAGDSDQSDTVKT